MQGKLSREKGFFGGYSNRKWGLEYFEVSVLKFLVIDNQRFRIYILPLKSPGTIIDLKVL